MSYYNMQETEKRLERVRDLLRKNELDAALVYYDEINIADGWYLTGWCPQFEKGAVLVPLKGEPMLLGGPESEPFAKMSSAIKETRCFSTFMVPEEEYPNATISTFETLAEMAARGLHFKRVGIVGTSYFPYSLYMQFKEGFQGAELIDITDEYDRFRYVKSPWEIENIRTAFSFTYDSFLAMQKKVRPGATEIEIAAEGPQPQRQWLRFCHDGRQRPAVQRGGAHGDQQGHGSRRNGHDRHRAALQRLCGRYGRNAACQR